MKLVLNSDEFRDYVLKEMDFKPIKETGYYTCYKNSQNEEYHHYYRKQCYEFGIADYTTTHNFQLQFANPDCLIRFGIVHQGKTHFKLKNQKISSFHPSTFFVVEKGIEGIQAWKKNQHFHGIEITIYEKYFNRIVQEFTGTAFNFTAIELNHTYHYLPNNMIQVIQQLQAIAISGNLNPIYLESKMLEFIALLCNETFIDKAKSSFLIQENSIPVAIGNRIIRLNPSNLTAIQNAHRILTQQFDNPPSIDELSQLVLLSKQKLSIGFQYHYHQSIHHYIITLRMATAANLLCTTDLHVEEIANRVGYSHSGNFIKMFQKQYGKTPLQYRMKHDPIYETKK